MNSHDMNKTEEEAPEYVDIVFKPELLDDEQPLTKIHQNMSITNYNKSEDTLKELRNITSTTFTSDSSLTNDTLQVETSSTQ